MSVRLGCCVFTNTECMVHNRAWYINANLMLHSLSKVKRGMCVCGPATKFTTNRVPLTSVGMQRLYILLVHYCLRNNHCLRL